MEHWIGLARAMERRGDKALQPVIAELEPGMLSGDKQSRRLAKVGESMGNRTELDGFRTRSNKQRNTRLAQLPP
jgi:hypothetical protein